MLDMYMCTKSKEKVGEKVQNVANYLVCRIP